MIRKISILFVLLCTILSMLAGCTAEPAQTETTMSPPVSADATGGEAPSGTTPVPEAPGTLPQSNIPRGTWQDGFFINEATGIIFLLPTSWMVLPEEQLVEYGTTNNEIIKEQFDITEDIIDNFFVYDMITMNQGSFNSVFIFYMDDKGYGFEPNNIFLEGLHQGAQDRGASFTVGEPEEFKVAGELYNGYHISAQYTTMPNVSVYTLFRDTETCWVCITIILDENTELNDILCYFLAEKDVTRGTWENNVFTNTYYGYDFSLPDGWVVISNEEIANLLQTAAEIYCDNSIWQTEILRSRYLIDTVVNDPVTGNEVSIRIVNLGAYFGDSRFTEYHFYENIKKNGQRSEELLLTLNAPVDLQIGDKSYMFIQGYNHIFETDQYYILRKQGGFLLEIKVMFFDGTSIDEILRHFK